MTAGPGRQTIWTYEDLGLLLGAILPCLLLSGVLERLGRSLAPTLLSESGVQALIFQSWLYLLLLGVLYLLAVKRHEQPLWQALGWITPFPGAWWCVFLAPVLAIGVSAAGALLRAPILQTPAEQLLAGRASMVAVAGFGTIIGPAFEELIFRGFLQSLFTRSLSPALAISAAAAPFALLHGPEYEWSWQHVLLIFGAGWVFGYVRHRTGSTAGAALLHMGYNLTLFAAYVAQRASVQ